MSDIEVFKKNIVGLSYPRKVRPEKNSERIRTQRFFSRTKRIWAQTLWWYIHLSWQDDPDRTREILKYNKVDMIGHLIERTGNGYREDLYRGIMKAYYDLPTHNNATFKAAAKLNLVKCRTIEPEFTEGGVPKYSKLLFDEVYKSNKDETGDDDEEIYNE